MRNLQAGSARLLLALFVVISPTFVTGCGGDEGDTPLTTTDTSDGSDTTDSTDATTDTDGTDGAVDDATTGDDDVDGGSETDDSDTADQSDVTDVTDTSTSSDVTDDADVTDGSDASTGDDTVDGSDSTDDTVPAGCPGDCPLDDNCEFCPLYAEDTQIACQDGPAATEACAEALLESGIFPVGSGGQVAFPACQQTVCATNGGIPRCELATVPNCAKSLNDCPDNSPCFTYAFTQLADEEKPSYLSDTAVGLCLQNTQFANPACCNGVTNTTVGDSSFNDTFPAGWTVIDPTPNDPVGWHLIDESLAPPQFSGRCLSGAGCMHFGYRKGESDNCLTYFNGDITIEKDGSGTIVSCTQTDPPSGCATDADCDSNNCGPQGSLDQPCPGAGQGCICRPSPSAATLQSDNYDLEEGKPWLLRFQLWMETEAPNLVQGLKGDSLEVWVKPSNGPETLVFDSATSVANDTQGVFQLVQVDLSPYNGQQVTLEWRFDTADGLNNYDISGNGNVLEGVFLDDIVVESSCFSETCVPGVAAELSGCATPASKCDVSECVSFEPKTSLAAEEPLGICATSTVQGCVTCTQASDCPTSGGGFEAVCVEGVCDEVLVACPESPAIMDFDSDLDGQAPNGWTTQDDPFCNNFWKVTNHRSVSGTQSLYFGNASNVCQNGESPSCGDLENGLCPTYDCGQQQTTGFAITAPMSLESTEAVLSFQLALSNEYDDGTVDQNLCDFLCSIYAPFYFADEGECLGAGGLCPDRLLLYAVVDKPTGSEEYFMWNSTSNLTVDGSTTCGFEPVNVLVPAEALGEPSVRFKFVYDSVEGSANENEGVYVDDLQMVYTCDLDTTCVTAADCPLLPCQEAQCVSGGCQYTATENCCATNADCDDGLLCTDDICDSQLNTCVNSIKADASCCDSQDPTYSVISFDTLTELPDEWSVDIADGTADTITWRLSTTGGLDGTAALYYGNEAGTTYGAANQISKGSITIPGFAIPPGGDPSVRFDLKLSTEFDDLSLDGFNAYLQTIQSTYLDRFAVYVSTDGDNFQLVWRSDDGQPLKGTTVNENGELAWLDVGFSMQAFAGQTVSLRLEFDTATSQVNNGGGVFIDNLRISQVCPSPELPSPCLADAWCVDDNQCTTDACVQGGCLITDNIGQPGCCFATPVMSYGFNGADVEGWTISNPTDSVRWHTSNVKSKEGPSALRFGNVNGLDYSSCSCGDPNACDGQCLPSECALVSGLSSPASVATSPPFTLEANKDYTINFSLYAGLNLDEGPLGFAEAFTVKLVIDDPIDPSDKLAVATLVCHAGECDVGFPPNACSSGVNFEYPSCNDPVGDYDKWLDYSLDMSDVLCSGGPFAQTLINTVKQNGSATLYLQVSMATNNNAGNCKEGLIIDDVRFDETCANEDGTPAWNNTCL
jgi:hypothetical protein